MMNLAEYRSRTAGLADFLPWAALGRRGRRPQQGRLAFSARRGFAVPISTARRRPNWSASPARLNNALRRLGSGWAIFVEAQRHPAQHYPDSRFPDPASALVDVERQAHSRRKARISRAAIS